MGPGLRRETEGIFADRMFKPIPSHPRKPGPTDLPVERWKGGPRLSAGAAFLDYRLAMTGFWSDDAFGPQGLDLGGADTEPFAEHVGTVLTQ
jgi:hypothetical protein